VVVKVLPKRKNLLCIAFARTQAERDGFLALGKSIIMFRYMHQRAALKLCTFLPLRGMPTEFIRALTL
jgi:hypothetical protein